MFSCSRILLSVTVAAALLISGCASVPMASVEADTAAKSFTAPSDQSRIYLYRNESMGGAVKIPVTLDGRMAGQTGPKTYFVWDVAPGLHELTCVGESSGKLSLTTKPGRAYYVWQEMKMGMWAASCALNEMDEQAGQKGVRECKLAQSQ